MRRLSVMAGVISAALMMSSAVFAQVPADPNNPNEAVPDAMTPPPYGEIINIEAAKRLPRVRLRKPRSGTGMDSAWQSSVHPAISFISKSRITASLRPSRFRNTRRAPRPVIGVRRWCSNAYSARATSSLICQRSTTSLHRAAETRWSSVVRLSAPSASAAARARRMMSFRRLALPRSSSFRSSKTIRRAKSPADFCHHSQTIIFDMTSPIVNNVAAQMNAETKLAI